MQERLLYLPDLTQSFSILHLLAYFEQVNEGKCNIVNDRYIIIKCHSRVRKGLWYWLIIFTTFTLLSSVGFVLMEIFRATKDEENRRHTSLNAVEGSCFFFLAIAWIPTVMVATTPGGPASLIGNAYFSTWLLVIFVFEGLVWFIHDMRQRIHKSLKEKQDEYRLRQQQIVEETRRIRENANSSMTEPEMSGKRERSGTEYFDATDTS